MNNCDIQEVQIGLDNAGKYLYQDVGDKTKDGDIAYKIELPNPIDYDIFYFGVSQKIVASIGE